MAQYMLLIYSPTEGSPEPIPEEHKLWAQMHQDMDEAGVLVSNAGLSGIDAATTVRVRDGETQITDGPFAETKELLAGAIVIQVDDLDAAIGWAAKVPVSQYGSVE